MKRPVAAKVPPLSMLTRPCVTVIGVDPGETTGFAILRGDRLVRCDELKTGVEALRDGTALRTLRDAILSGPRPSVIGIEDYKVYGWMKDEHAWSELHTAKLIGMLLAICQDADIKVQMAMAAEAKDFATDGALAAWGLWLPGKRHGRDAIRHAVLTAFKLGRSKN